MVGSLGWQFSASRPTQLLESPFVKRMRISEQWRAFQSPGKTNFRCIGIELYCSETTRHTRYFSSGLPFRKCTTNTSLFSGHKRLFDATPPAGPWNVVAGIISMLSDVEDSRKIQ